VKGVLLLSTRHLLANPGLALVLIVCLALTGFVPVVTGVLATRYERTLVARGHSTPLVAGATGSRFDLVLAALYFRRSDIQPVRFGVCTELRAVPDLLAIPIHTGYTAQGEPLVGTSVDYFQWRGLRAERGRLPALIGEAVVGARVAARLGLAPGETIFTDQPELYDLAKPPAIRLLVVGVLSVSGTPDDDAVFTDMKTVWMAGGFLHGHRDAETIEEGDLLIGRTDEHVAVSGALIEHNEARRDNLASFHLHGDADELPLTAVIVDPATAKAGTMMKARMNVIGAVQMVEPREVVDELLEFVFRIKEALDALSVVLAVCTGLLGALVIMLSLRLRAPEIATLHRMGCGRSTVFRLCLSEIAIIVAAAFVIAAAGVAAAARFAPDLIRHL